MFDDNAAEDEISVDNSLNDLADPEKVEGNRASKLGVTDFILVQYSL